MLRLALNDGPATAGVVQTPARPKYYVWWFPGSPVKVHLALPVVEHLADNLQNQGAVSPPQGILLGRFLEGATEILDVRPASNLKEFLASGSDVKHQAVGYYRTEAGETLRLNDNDRALAEAFFVKPHHVVLLIQTTGFGPPNATFFFRDSGGSLVEFPVLEFPLDPSQLALEERDRIERAHSANLTPPDPPKALPTPERKGSPFKVTRAMKITASTLLIAGVFAFGVWLIRDGLNDRLHRLQNNAAQQSAAAPIPRGPLGLEVVRQGTDIRVTWNHKADAISGAVSGVLSIDDGGTIRKINLDSQEVRDGSIIYSPTGTQIRLQLTIFGSHESVSESAILVSSQTPEPQPTGLSKTLSPPASVVTHIQQSQNAGQPTLNRRTPPTTAGLPSGLGAPVYQPPVIVRSATAVYPSDLLNQTLDNKIVKIKVSLDEMGQILKAEPLPSTEPIPQSMIDAALQAARLSQFGPAHQGPTPIPGNAVLQFAFKRPK